MQRDEAYLLDIVLAARRAIKYASNISRAKFEEDEMVQDAVARTLEIIGEAAGLVSEDFREAHSEIPWHLMVGMRNRIIHDDARQLGDNLGYRQKRFADVDPLAGTFHPARMMPRARPHAARKVASKPLRHGLCPMNALICV